VTDPTLVIDPVEIQGVKSTGNPELSRPPSNGRHWREQTNTNLIRQICLPNSDKVIVASICDRKPRIAAFWAGVQFDAIK
jgi:hypothetical protein